jgi:endoglucanase
MPRGPWSRSGNGVRTATQIEERHKTMQVAITSRAAAVRVGLGLLLFAGLSTSIEAQTNLALNRPVIVSSSESTNLRGRRAVDGNGTTRWASAEGSDPQWIQVDLGAPRNLGRVVLRWEDAYARAYRVEVSPDGASWTTLFSTTDGDGGVDSLTLAGSGRYVRVFGTQRGTPWGYSLWELEVYAATLPPPVPAGLTATPVSSARIDVSWAAAVGATGYDLELDGLLAAGASSPHAHTGLAAGSTHAYRVRSKNAAGASAWSGSVSATTLAACASVPPVPINLRSTSVTSTSIGVAWDPVTAGPQCTVQYRVYSNGVVHTQSAASSATLTGLTPATSYDITVDALTTAGASSPSAPLVVSTSAGGTPVAINGQLHVCGTQLCNQFGHPIQLRGMSTHGLQWYGWGDCVTPASLDALATDWQADILRLSLYVQEGGYATNPTAFTNQVHTLIEEVSARGLYVLVDWHMLDPGDPYFNLERAKTYFTAIAQAHANKPNVLYEIANEPNGVDWARIKSYAEELIPVIRQHDPDAVIIVGTPGWSSLGVSDGGNALAIVNAPIAAANVMYTFHFYAASHLVDYRNELAWAADRLPIFVTEWGTQEFTGDGANDFDSAQAYLDLMAAKKISWTSWNFSDDPRSGAAFHVGTCPGGPWTGKTPLKPAGAWVRDRILTPDNFPTH